MSTSQLAEVPFVQMSTPVVGRTLWSSSHCARRVEIYEGRRRGALIFQEERSTHLHFVREFTTDTVKGMLAKPENREEAVANLFKSCGGKLIGWYLTFGHHDWLVIGEFPDE